MQVYIPAPLYKEQKLAIKNKKYSRSLKKLKSIDDSIKLCQVVLLNNTITDINVIIAKLNKKIKSKTKIHKLKKVRTRR